MDVNLTNPVLMFDCVRCYFCGTDVFDKAGFGNDKKLKATFKTPAVSSDLTV